MSEKHAAAENVFAEDWNRADAYWELFQERANESQNRNLPVATVLFGSLAGIIAIMCFSRRDLRRVTSAANMAHVLHMIGLRRLSRRRYQRLHKRWTGVTAGIVDISIKPRARSSLFHLRMEALHRKTYKANTMIRMRRFMDETSECLYCLGQGQDVPHRLFARWRGEKFPVHDDTRRILAACLLVIASGERK